MFKKNLICFMSILTLSTIPLISCTHIDKTNEQTHNSSNNTFDSAFENSYIYINNGNQLIISNKDSKSQTIVSSNVLDFSIGTSSLTYSHRDTTGKHLSIYYSDTNTYEQFKDYYNSDYIMYNNLLFYMNDNTIESYNIETKETKTIYNANTNDLVFNYIDDSILIFSSIRNGVPATQKYSFKDNAISLVYFNATNIVVLGDYIYGLDHNLNIFRIGNDENIDVISDFPVLKFYIDNNFLVYIDADGQLNSLDLNRNNRVISSSVNDFIVNNNELYYTTTSNPGYVYKTQLSGRHRDIILKDSNANFLFREIS